MARLGALNSEYAAVTHYFAAKIRPLQLQGPHFVGSSIKALEDLMLQYAHGSRIDGTLAWLVTESAFVESMSRGTSKAVNATLTALSDGLVRTSAAGM